MSVIGGIVRRDGQPVDPGHVARMAGTLGHRFPAGYRVLSAPGVALIGAASTDPELDSDDSDHSERQRAIAGGGHPPAMLVLHGCIYNRAELASAVGMRAAPLGPADCVDRQLALMAYRKWGGSCPERLVGDYAFAVWDSDHRRLFCARDAIGVKPFYYHDGDSVFAFCSEIKGLLSLPEVSRDICEQRVADYLAVSFDDKSTTFYEQIRRLPPAHVLTVSEASSEIRCYWSLDPDRALPPASDQEYAERFREIFVEAVRSRLEGAASPGLLLSGGLDSTSILGVARDLGLASGAEPLATVSASFSDDDVADEQAWVNEALASGACSPSCVDMKSSSPLGSIDQLLRHAEEPFHVPNLFIYWELARHARERGLRVLLDGVDGDTTVSHGLEYLTELFRKCRFRALLREARSLGRRLRQPGRRFVWRNAVVPVFAPPIRRLTGLFWPRHAEQRMPAIASAAFLKRIGWQDRVADAHGSRGRPARSLRESHHRQLTSGLLPYYLEVHDKVSGGLGLDHRHPFYDQRLMEFCLAVPPQQKLHGGWDRLVQRRAMEGLVPSRIQWRIRKAYWGDNFERKLLGPDRKLLEEMAHDRSDQLDRFIDKDVMRLALSRCLAGDYSQTDAMGVWVATTLGIWLEQRP